MKYEWSLIMNRHFNYVLFKSAVNRNTKALHLNSAGFLNKWHITGVTVKQQAEKLNLFFVWFWLGDYNY